jgi:Putative transposase/Transposase zinc-binding domain
MRYKRPLKQILSDNRDLWDHPKTCPVVRENFNKLIDCGTPALGAEIYASTTETKAVYHTCKSKTCPSCGHKATLLWQREQWTQLPDIPYAGITFTMPNVLWPIFRANRHLLHDLPALGAEVIKQYMHQQHGIRPSILVVPHTFGRHLNFNTHLHILASQGGLKVQENRWVSAVSFDLEFLRKQWRDAVIEYLKHAVTAGVLASRSSKQSMRSLFDSQGRRRWMIHIDPIKSKTHFLQYAARYVRRPPVAEHRFTEISDREVAFWTKDLRLKRRVQTRYTIGDFIAALADQVPAKYKHAIRYFGLLSPRTKHQTSIAFFALLGQSIRRRPRRLTWAESIERYFRRNPLLDSAGELMSYVGRQAPSPIR